jgi:hypothetical protein
MQGQIITSACEQYRQTVEPFIITPTALAECVYVYVYTLCVLMCMQYVIEFFLSMNVPEIVLVSSVPDH